jgi:hypothetical protein
MFKKIWEKRILITSICFFLIAALLYVMPPEKDLGSKVRLVYFHASIAENSIIFFVLGGLFALLSFMRKNSEFYGRAVSFFLVGFYLWILQTILGGINMKVIWGNFFWSEPKARMGLILLAISLFIYLLIEFNRSGLVLNRAALILMAVAAIAGLLFTSNVFHPKNAIFGSDVLAYKVIFVLLVAAWIVINLLWSEALFRKVKS